MLVRGAYMTKKRKREFELTYELIDEKKLTIENVKIVIESHQRYGRFDEVESSEKYLNKLKQELQDYEKQGWSIE